MKYILTGNVYKLVSCKNEVFNFKKYKDARFHLEKLKAILLVVNTSIRAFQIFEAYAAAGNCLRTLRAEKIMLEVSIAKCKAILESKGKF